MAVTEKIRVWLKERPAVHWTAIWANVCLTILIISISTWAGFNAYFMFELAHEYSDFDFQGSSFIVCVAFSAIGALTEMAFRIFFRISLMEHPIKVASTIVLSTGLIHFIVIVLEPEAGPGSLIHLLGFDGFGAFFHITLFTISLLMSGISISVSLLLLMIARPLGLMPLSKDEFRNQQNLMRAQVLSR